jgi:N-sulfoglucosamine sulfohydrolase
MMLRSIVVALIACCGLHPLSPRAQGASDRERQKPNILFLLSDDHSYPFLSCYGDGNVKTPNLDRLASEGMRFHRFFTTAPQCVPSRASLMTGRSPVAARITRFSSPLAKDEITLPEILREKGGYFTGICGRAYHLDGAAPKGNSEISKLLRDRGMKTFATRVDYLDSSRGEGVEAKVEEFLEQRPAEKPFFLWVNFNNPHHPWDEMSDRPDPASLKLPSHWPDLPGVREQLANYCGEVNRLDRQVQACLDVLAKRGFAENTIVIFAGDNGAALPHGKGSLYDPGSNVPFVVRWPGVVKPGGESRALLSGEDLAPTILAAAALAAPVNMTGASFLPLLRGEEHTPRRHIFVERGPHGSAPVTVNMSSSGYDLGRAVRSDRYKLIYNCTPWIPYSPVDSAGGRGWTEMKSAHAEGKLDLAIATTYFTSPRPVYELYDLDSDPSELENLSGKPALVEVEYALRLALAEKMVLDFDYLPLPDLGGDPRSRPAGSRAATFDRLDVDGDGKLTKEEFSVGRRAEAATRWFTERDSDGDELVSREEFLPGSPTPKKNANP